MKKTNRLISLLLALTMIFALAACSGSNDEKPTESTPGSSAQPSQPENAGDPAADGQPVLGGTLTSVYSEFYGEYDPSAYSNRCNISFHYDMLWNIDWAQSEEHAFASDYLDGTLIAGSLAESWEVAPDFTSLTVTLRDNVTFQDKVAAGFDSKYDIFGARKLVAGDVKWSYDRLLGLDGTKQVILDQTSWPTQLSMLESVEVKDDRTVVFHFNTNTELAVENFMCVRVNIAGPEWDELNDDQKTDWHYANGTGPFILTDYITDNTMTFSKNPNYWAVDENGIQLPYLDTVELVYIADKSTALASFLSGSLDIVPANGTYFDADHAAQIASSMSSDQYYSVSYAAQPMGIGLKQGVSAPLDDVRVRMAMQYAIDLESTSAFRGYVYPDGASISDKLAGVFSTSTAWGDLDSWSDELIESYTTYNPEKAKELLDAAGYPDGFEFDVTIFAYLPTELFQLVGEYLSKVGIKMNLTIGNVPPDMTSVGEDPNNPNSVFYTICLPALNSLHNSLSSDGVLNYVHQKDAKVDDLISRVLNATTREEQISAAKELDQTYMEQHYTLLITYAEMYRAFLQSDVHGFNNANPYSNYYFGQIYAHMWKDAA